MQSYSKVPLYCISVVRICLYLSCFNYSHSYLPVHVDLVFAYTEVFFIPLPSGTASVARGFSQYVNALANDSIKDALQEAVPLSPEDSNSFISTYPDFLSFGLAVVLSGV